MGCGMGVEWLVCCHALFIWTSHKYKNNKGDSCELLWPTPPPSLILMFLRNDKGAGDFREGMSMVGAGSGNYFNT